MTKLAQSTHRQAAAADPTKNFPTFLDKGKRAKYLGTGQEVDFRIYYSSDDSNVQNVSVAIGITEFGCVC